MEYRGQDFKSGNKTISIPGKYLTLVNKVLAWLDNCDKQDKKFQLISNLIKVNYDDETKDTLVGSKKLLTPVAYFEKYPLTRECMQSLIDKYDFIYSALSLETAINLIGGFTSEKGKQVTYRQIYQWKLGYPGNPTYSENERKIPLVLWKEQQNNKAISFIEQNRKEIITWLKNTLSEDYKTK